MQVLPTSHPRNSTKLTYLGQVHGTLAALKYMRRRNRGVIICIGSALAYRSIPFQGPYCSAQAAVRGFVNSLRSELLYEQSKIRLTMVHLPSGEYSAVRCGTQQVRSQGCARAADLPAGNNKLSRSGRAGYAARVLARFLDCEGYPRTDARSVFGRPRCWRKAARRASNR